MIVQVAVPGPFRTGLDYQIPPHFGDQDPLRFCRVIVPLRNKHVIGFVISTTPSSQYTAQKVKPIIERIDTTPLLTPVTFEIILWVGRYYHCHLFDVLKAALPQKLLTDQHANVSQASWYHVTEQKASFTQQAKQQKAAYSYLKQHGPCRYQTLKQAQYQRDTLNRLVKKGYVASTHQVDYQLVKPPLDQAQLSPIKLTDSQKNAIETIENAKGFAPFLLFGPTNSGKTEVYLQIVALHVANATQVLVLVPEINLIPQTAQRFQQRFNNSTIAMVHSQITPQEKLDTWFAVQQGHVDILIATRSGLFFSFAKLGLIIIDEEHDHAFKQAHAPRYHARDVALVQAKKRSIPIILGSATPSLESYYQAQQGKFTQLTLMPRANQTLNHYYCIDLTKNRPNCGISFPLQQAITRHLEANHQVLIFINRRGFARSLICPNCGWCATCQRCEKPYTMHVKPYQYLACHFCHTSINVMIQCPECHSESLDVFGTGTEKIERFLTQTFPDHQVVRLDRTATARKGTLQTTLEQIADHSADIIIGTQMVSKGHHFDQIGLVGIINADAGFYSQDFRALENTAQLITQVSGRAGRSESMEGQIYLQTYQSDHPVLQKMLKQSYTCFLDELLQKRRCLDYPPFTAQCQIQAEANHPDIGLNALTKLQQILNTYGWDDLFMTDPLAALHHKLAGRYRHVLLLTSRYRRTINQAAQVAYSLIYQQRAFPKAKLVIDIDPIDTL